MVQNQIKQLVESFISEVWNKGNLQALRELSTENYTYTLNSQPARNRQAMEQFLTSVRLAFPDWKVHIIDMLVEGNKAAVRWSGEVTHNGVFLGMKPTGRRIGVAGINIYHIQDDKISQEFELMDSLGMLQQLDAVPEAAK